MKPMRQQFIRLLVVSGVAAGLAACATPATTVAPTATVAAAMAQPTPQPTLDVGSLVATPDTGSGALVAPVSGSGEIKTLNDADLNFLVSGTVRELLVKEGDSVKKDTLLASLDTTIYDQQVLQAEANLTSAKAQLAGYDVSGPDSLAAKAQLAQAQAAVDATKPNSTSADVEAAKLSLAAAKYTLQSTKDRLSLSKTQAQIQLDLANQSLAQAEAQYSIDKFNWDWVAENGTDPYTPTAMGRPIASTKPPSADTRLSMTSHCHAVMRPNRHCRVLRLPTTRPNKPNRWGLTVRRNRSPKQSSHCDD